MKQAALFLVLFVAGLAVLFFLLGTEDLIQDYDKPEIEAGAVGALPDSVGVNSSSQQARFGLPSRLEGPFTAPRRVRDADTGEVREVKTSWLQLPSVSRFEGGVFSENPTLDLFREDGTVSVRLHGNLGTLYATAAAGASAASLDSWEAESFHVTGDVVIDWMDETGETVELQILTQSLLIPGPDPGGGAWDTVECPEPLTLRRPDGSLVLTAARARVEPDERLAVLSGPIHLEARDLDLLGVAAPGEPLETLIVDGDGELIYRWEERERRASDPIARMRGGTVTLARNVHATQGDRWVHGEHVEMRLSPRPKGQGGLELQRLVVTAPGPVPVRFGLFSGEGSAESVSMARGREELQLQGPVLLEGALLERKGRAPLRLDRLAATDRALLRVLPPDGGAVPPAVQDGSRQLELTLEGDASLVARELADARSDLIQLRVRQVPNGEGNDTSLEELTLDGHAVLDLPPRSGLGVTGHADHVSVRPTADGGQRIQLDGAPARLDLEGDEGQRLRGGFLEGPGMVVTAPEDPALASTLSIPNLTDAELVLDARAMGAFVAKDGPRTQRVIVAPTGPCGLDASEDLLTLAGAVLLRLPRDAERESTLVCEEFRLEELASDRPVARALGQVHFQDPAEGLDVRCQDLVGGETWVARGADTHVVQEPAGGPRLELWGDTVEYTPEGGPVRASRAGGLARVEGPEELLDAVLPPPEDPLVPRGRVVLEAPSFEVWTAEEDQGDRKLRRLVTHGGSSAMRTRDGARLEACDVDLDLLALEGRVEGTEEAPVLLRQPVEGQVDAVDEVRALWLQLRDQGRRLEIAPGAAFRFHLRGSGQRVTLDCTGPAILEGAELHSDEGVFLSVTSGAAALTAAAERLVVQFDAPLLDGGRPREFLVRQRVVWTHPDLSGTAALLAYRLQDQALDIKAGTEPCTVTSSAQALPFPMRAEFRRLSALMLLDRPGLPLEHLVLEYGRVDRADVVRGDGPSPAPQR